MYAEFSGKGFEILAFPCNQFGGQEPGSDADVKAFAQSKGSTFPLFSKIDVNGANTCAPYKFLKEKSSSGDITWNFQKYLVNGAGQVVSFHGPKTAPNELRGDLTKLLGL